MENLLKLLLKKRSYPLNKIYLSKENLLHNYRYLSSINPDIKIAPVLKSNAYGHGIEIVGKALDLFIGEAPFFCVDSLLEAYQLKKANVKLPVLIIGCMDPESVAYKKLPFSYALYDLNFAKVLDKYQKNCQVHIFVDTGMNREGVSLKDLDKFVKVVKVYKNINIVGLMSHLSDPDNPNSIQNLSQLKKFEQAKLICKNNNLDIKWYHLGGGAFIKSLSKKNCNLLRAGLAIYGVENKPVRSALKPVLKLTTKLVQIKEINQGDRVGYGGVFKASKKITIGILPIGYYDGVDRRLSNKAFCLVNGVGCQILGMISMNITVIDLSKIKNPQLGQEVIVYSDNLTHPNTISKSAKIAQTIPYDILVHLAYSTRRELI